jgi:hypothetical protein
VGKGRVPRPGFPFLDAVVEHMVRYGNAMCAGLEGKRARIPVLDLSLKGFVGRRTRSKCEASLVSARLIDFGLKIERYPATAGQYPSFILHETQLMWYNDIWTDNSMGLRCRVAPGSLLPGNSGECRGLKGLMSGFDAWDTARMELAIEGWGSLRWALPNQVRLGTKTGLS